MAPPLERAEVSCFLRTEFPGRASRRAIQEDNDTIRKTGDPLNAREMIEAWQGRGRQIRTDVYALCLAHRDPRIAWYTKALAACVAAYAFSPIDLIPDFIPILGYLDDVILIPLGVALVLKMIPGEILDEYRLKAETALAEKRPRNWIAGGVILLIWLVLITLVFGALKKGFGK